MYGVEFFMKRERGTWKVWAVTILLFAVVVLATIQVKDQAVLNITGKNTKELVMVDPGHGGFDPGKVGVGGTLEKDVNLSIALKLKQVLEDSGYQVLLTREEDQALCHEKASGKKLSDLKSRVSMINENKPALTVSIHQNSYSAGTKGAQVFYYNKSEESHAFATILQETVKEKIADGNHRVEKGNDSYYMLKKTEGVFAIIECGFLSNPQEEKLLKSGDYQQKMANAIAEGIENFLYNH